MKIGILALQGAFLEHQKILNNLKIENTLVKSLDDLNKIDGIILPGGESTAIGKLLKELNIFDTLKKKIENGFPVFGTCAGMILLAKKLSNDNITHLATMDIEVKRNAYGRQLGSFETLGNFKGIDQQVKMVFIRAPYVEKVGNNVTVLSITNAHITAVQQGNMLATSFHPELTDDNRVHKYFLQIVEKYLNE